MANNRSNPENSTFTVSKITKIEAQKRKGRYNIYLDGIYAFPVDESIVAKYMLHKNMEISENFKKQLEAEDGFQKAYSRSLNYLGYALRSEKEIIDDLLAHEYSAHTAQDVCTKLKEQGYINDQVYAESYIRTAANLTGKGPLLIKRELKKRGVADERIEEAMDEYPLEQMVENGVELAEKVIRRSSRSSSRETSNKIRQNLMQKGFNSEVINLVMEQIETEKEEEDEYEALKIQGDKIWRKQSRLKGSKKIQKVKSSLYQKGFSGDLITQFINEKEMEEEE